MTILTDVMNQIALILRSDQALRTRLRTILTQICDLPEYAKWQDTEQYDGRRFRLPHRFISAATSDRRLLESLRLVVNDMLEVKLNCLDNGSVYMTDGLFVPADYRVFPFSDESDHLIRKLTTAGWLNWATAVIDPATGCGHNALRVDAIHRFGFDISVRALSFAAVNSYLNEKQFTALAFADIERGIPLLLSQGVKNTLFVVNMPFALEPVSGTLARTAAGGKNGYEKTVSALNAIKGYMANSADSKVRAVVLAYSIGNHGENRWVVFEEAKKIFESADVSWELFKDEQLWRVNGKKEQPNPMPLSSMKLKADCRYHVRDSRMREPIRSAYIEKERDLLRQGYDSLAYGILSIDTGGNK